MEDTEQSKIFNYTISKNNLSSKLEILINKILNIQKPIHQNSTLPLFIFLDIDTPADKKAKLTIMEFLRELNNIQQSYFVRFIAHSKWIDVSAGTDFLYNLNQGIRDICGISWDINVDDENDIKIITEIYKPSESHIHILNVSSKLSTHIEDLCMPTGIDSVMTYFENIYTNLNGNVDIREIKSDLHLILVYDKDVNDKPYYRVIPLAGMNRARGIEKFRVSFKDVLESYFVHSDILPSAGIPSSDNLLTIIINLVQESNSHKDMTKRDMELYALGEMIYSYHHKPEERDSKFSKHDIILFKPSDKYKNYFETYLMSMDDIADKIFKVT